MVINNELLKKGVAGCHFRYMVRPISRKYGFAFEDSFVVLLLVSYKLELRDGYFLWGDVCRILDKHGINHRVGATLYVKKGYFEEDKVGRVFHYRLSQLLVSYVREILSK